MVTTVNDAEIKALAERFGDLLKPYNDHMKLFPENGLLPGEFDDGDNLRILFDTRKKELVDGLDAMTRVIAFICAGLTEIGEKYRKTEDDNSVTAADLESLIKQVKEDLPGIQL